MENTLTRKLERFSPLSVEDKALLATVVSTSYTVGAHQDLIREGDTPDAVYLIVSGMACRNKVLKNGGRQIIAYLLPGDFCDFQIFILDKMDHSISTLSPCTVVSIPRETILRLTERPAIARALWWATLVDEGTLREALVNMGRRKADERVAHFMCELFVRLEAVGLVTDDSFEFPVTQSEIADTLGLSAVHVNRTLQQLRSHAFINLERKILTILNLEGPKIFSGFSSNYLHLGVHRTKCEPYGPELLLPTL